MRQINYIAIHCTGGPQTQTLQSIKAHWRRQGWRSPGYHHLIMPDGTDHQLAQYDAITNGVQGFNRNLINVSYVGGVGSKGEIVDNRTRMQRQQLEFRIRALLQQFPNASVMGHRDFSPDRNRNGIIEPSEWLKACPSFSVRAWLEEVGIINNRIPEARRAEVATNTGASLLLRSGPGTNHSVLLQLQNGSTLLVLEGKGDWSFVQVDDRLKGWVRSDFLK